MRAAHRGATLISPTTLQRLVSRLGGEVPWLGSSLTGRELEVLELVAEGLPNKQVAAEMSLSLNTVRNHVQRLVSKLGAHNKLEAVAVAMREGIILAPRERARGSVASSAAGADRDVPESA